MAKSFVDISLIGGPELQETFAAIETNLQKKVIRKAARPPAQMIRREAMALVPRDETGALAAIIKVRAVRRPKVRGRLKAVVGAAVVVDAEKAGLTYLGAVHYGRTTKSGRKTKDTPFLEGALNVKRGSALSLFKTRIQFEIEAHARGLAGKSGLAGLRGAVGGSSLLR